MAMRTQILIDVLGTLGPPGDESGGANGIIDLDELWGDGTATRQSESMLYDVRSLGAGANEDVHVAVVLAPAGELVRQPGSGKGAEDRRSVRLQAGVVARPKR